MGYTVTQQLARGRYYWKTLNEDIKQRCQGCAACIEFSPSKGNEEEVIEEPPSFPMKHMSVDLFTWNQKKFTLLVDWCLGYCFLKEFRTEPNARDIITFLEGIFHKYGYPEKMRLERGGQFHSEFGDFTKRAGINTFFTFLYI